ncbi:hypothetical protein C1H46_007365 [Malus baccata]|uniref:F-box associated domain-containing protein n=1 Tax=Malus baccata TaxID=106549 RepID=A0A540N7D6_MALBA|nr:hypothetical protein C1H46_007365 [Malus baccata]
MLQTFRTNFQPSRLQAAFIPTDLATKEYCQFPTPVDGDDSTEMSDVWIMKKYGVTESWTLLYSIEQEALPCALKRYKPGEEGKPVTIRGLPLYLRVTVCVRSICLLDRDSLPVGSSASPFLPLRRSQRKGSTSSRVLMFLPLSRSSKLGRNAVTTDGWIFGEVTSMQTCFQLMGEEGKPVTIRGLPLYLRVTVCVRSICLLDRDSLPVGSSRESLSTSKEESAKGLYLF